MNYFLVFLGFSFQSFHIWIFCYSPWKFELFSWNSCYLAPTLGNVLRWGDHLLRGLPQNWRSCQHSYTSHLLYVHVHCFQMFCHAFRLLAQVGRKIYIPQFANPQILGLSQVRIFSGVPFRKSQVRKICWLIRKFLKCASPLIANPQIFFHTTERMKQLF
jgi:hypothetical protein